MVRWTKDAGGGCQQSEGFLNRDEVLAWPTVTAPV